MSLLPYAQSCAGTYVDGARPAFEDDHRLTHVFITEIDGHPCLTFEGTDAIEEWIWRDFLVLNLDTVDHPEFGFLHGGIARGVFGVIDQLYAHLESLGWPTFDLSGHSKGAGECLIAAAEFKRRGHPPHFFAAFEAPHVGGPKLVQYCHDLDGVETATVNSHGRDIVTVVPWATPFMAWQSVKPRLMLTVPDSYDIPTKHRIPAVIDALGRM